MVLKYKKNAVKKQKQSSFELLLQLPGRGRIKMDNLAIDTKRECLEYSSQLQVPYEQNKLLYTVHAKLWMGTAVAVHK